MSAPPLTRASLLVRLRDPNDVSAWKEFVQLYASIIYGFARKRGLQDADAADLMQEVLRSVSSAMGRLNYDPAKGTFRGWLYSITRNKIYTFLESRARQARAAGDSNSQQRLEELPNRPGDTDDWDKEYERKSFAWAAERVKHEFQPATWKAFWKTAVDGESPKDVGRELGMSPGAVYVAKSRVIARLRDEISQLNPD
ncbi:RNA polymerase sigma factor [Zavarzinella formosa]|uniref:RNA polymerase sigma factor n=1 Tax=Zavarzinella formosa TaxID=360055 RepID=UPI00036F6A59|nr:sigma-70 family RNA polymerase sigma factor [Zavarzinella formosa]